MSAKNFMSNGDAETVFTAFANAIKGKKDKYETITYAQWQAMTPEQQAAKDYYISNYPASVLTAGNIAYDNTSSDMAANKVQGAIDELKNGLTNRVKRFSIGEITGQTLSDFVLGVIKAIANDIGVCECCEVFAIYPNVNYFMFNVMHFEGNNFMFITNNTTAMYYGTANTSANTVSLYLITATQQ